MSNLDFNKLDFNKDESIVSVYRFAKEIFYNGIAVPTQNHHPCGWSWLDFSWIEEGEILNYKFKKEKIDEGFGNVSLEGKTLKEILFLTNGQFAVDVECDISWYGDNSDKRD